ncbi:Proteasome subunit beta type-5 [Sarcoptes scabiei]|uniref:Proteasome subunit beta n=1 Tax=Sarcoptes scabiei TaxID=52283 RepID=A0A834VH61_SARSC|nr:Proteasome subunit beta type-5 [Sarcoptes scabiei]
MALESFLRLNPKEKFDRNHKRLEISDCQELIENEHHPFNLSIPRISLNLNSLYDASNPSKKIAMKFNKGTTTLAFVYKGGVVVCADSRATGGQYISTQHCKKIIVINDFLLGTMAGGAADFAAASKILANILYSYKGMGLSLGVMICGWDVVRGPQIFYVDNEGNRMNGNLFSVGSGSTFAYGVLDSGYRFDLSDDEAYDLGRRAIFHATHRDGMSGGIVRVYTIKQDGWKKITEQDMDNLYDAYNMPRP